MEKICKNCKKPFEVKHSNQRYCSYECRSEFYARKGMAGYSKRGIVKESEAMQWINKEIESNERLLSYYKNNLISDLEINIATLKTIRTELVNKSSQGEELRNLARQILGEEETPKSADVPSETKRCYKCKRDLPLSEFHRDASRRDGLMTSCKECDNKRKRVTEEDRRRQYTRHKEKGKQKGRKLLFKTVQPIYSTIVKDIMMLIDDEKWHHSKEFINIIKIYYPKRNTPHLQNLASNYRRYLRDKLGYTIDVEHRKRKRCFKATKPKLDRQIINGTKEDSIPVTASHSMDRRSIKDKWNLFKIKR